MEELGILATLVAQDFGIDGRGKWLRSNKHSSLVIDNERNIFHWNSKEIVGGPLEYLIKVRKMPFFEAKEYLKTFRNFSETFVYTVKPDSEVIVYPPLVDFFYEQGQTKENREYFYKRGINDVTIDRFQCGWYNGFATIPLFYNNTFRQIQLRKDPEGKNPRIIKRYYRGVGPSPFNFDILKLVDEVYITEGLTDCLRLTQEGLPAVSQDNGAGYWDIAWFKHFIRQKDIYVVYDSDDAGRHGIKKVANSLGIYRTHLYTFGDMGEGYDIVDFFKDGGTKEDFEKQVKEKSKFLFEL